MKKQVYEMLRDIIRPFKSSWASPVVLVKKDETLHFCINYRPLDKSRVYPLPSIAGALDRLHSVKYFSSMELKANYWQIEVDKRDREKAAFITPDGLFEFKVMPFGLCSTPEMFK